MAIVWDPCNINAHANNPALIKTMLCPHVCTQVLYTPTVTVQLSCTQRSEQSQMLSSGSPTKKRIKIFRDGWTMHIYAERVKNVYNSFGNYRYLLRGNVGPIKGAQLVLDSMRSAFVSLKTLDMFIVVLNAKVYPTRLITMMSQPNCMEVLLLYYLLLSLLLLMLLLFLLLLLL